VSVSRRQKNSTATLLVAMCMDVPQLQGAFSADTGMSTMKLMPTWITWRQATGVKITRVKSDFTRQSRSQPPLHIETKWAGPGMKRAWSKPHSMYSSQPVTHSWTYHLERPVPIHGGRKPQFLHLRAKNRAMLRTGSGMPLIGNQQHDHQLAGRAPSAESIKPPLICRETDYLVVVLYNYRPILKWDIGRI